MYRPDNGPPDPLSYYERSLRRYAGLTPEMLAQADNSAVAIANNLLRDAASILARRDAARQREAAERSAKSGQSSTVSEAAYPTMWTSYEDGTFDEDSLIAYWRMGLVDGQVSEALLSRLETLRNTARRLFETNTHYGGIIMQVVHYIVGRCPSVTITDEQDQPATEVMKKWANIKRRVRFASRAVEFATRYLRDGEVFMRKMSDPINPRLAAWRFIEPETVKEPNEEQIRAAGRGRVTGEKAERETSRTFGIEVLKDDVETVLGYWVSGKFVPAAEIIHLKCGVDANVKRGLPYLLRPEAMIRRYSNLLEDRAVMHKVRTAIAIVRKLTADAAGTHSAGTSTFQSGSVLFPNEVSGQNEEVKRFRIRPGTMLCPPRGVEYEYVSPEFDAADAEHDLRAFRLAIAVGTQLPEFIVSGDASNNAYASILVAESPGVMTFLFFQEICCGGLEDAVRWSLVHEGALTAAQAEQYTIRVKGPNVIVRDMIMEANSNHIKLHDRVISRAEWQRRDNTDPAQMDEEIRRDETEPIAAAIYAARPSDGTAGLPEKPGVPGGEVTAKPKEPATPKKPESPRPHKK